MKKKNNEEIAALVNAEITDALGYYESEISQERAAGLDLYLGRPYGDEQENRSSIVTRDIFQAVESAMSSVLKIFVAGDDIVKVDPTGPEDEALADQQSDYANHIFYKQNPGYRIMETWIRDAFISKNGIVKAFYDETETSEVFEYSGLTEDELVSFVTEKGVELEEVSADEQEGVTLFDCTIRRTYNKDGVKIENVAPEEFLISKRATSIEDAPFVCHRSQKTVTELINMGFDAEKVTKLPAANGDMNEEYLSRYDTDEYPEDSIDESQKEVWINECYLRMDVDGTGVGRLYRVFVGGEDGSSELLEIDECAEVPFFSITPFPLTHRFFGQSLPDILEDIQRTRTNIVRGQIDSLFMANNPRVLAVENQVNLDDLMTNRVGGIVRAKRLDAVREFNTTWVGGQTLPFLGVLDKERESRTGQNAASEGLDPSALQSSTAAGVNATIQAATSRIETISRTFAETGVKELFRYILKLVTRHQNKAEVVRLRGEWVSVDPRSWNTDLDVTVQVGLGYANQESEMAFLMNILNLQKEALSAGGLGMVTPKKVHNTLKRLVKVGGLKTIEPYFDDPDKTQQQQQPPKPDPAQVTAQAAMQIEQMKTQAKVQTDQAKLQADMQMDQARLQFDQQKAAAELQLKREIEQAKLQVAFSKDSGKKPEKSEKQAPVNIIAGNDAARVMGDTSQLVNAGSQQTAAMIASVAQQAQQSAARTEQLMVQMNENNKAIAEGQRNQTQALAGAIASSQIQAGEKIAEATEKSAKVISKASDKQAKKMDEVADALTAPKKIIKDKSGKPVGVKIDRS